MTSEALIGTPGPFEIRCEEHTVDAHSPCTTRGEFSPTFREIPPRRYECDCYETCLGLAASLNWEGFTCRGCCGQPNEKLMWRARVSARKDSVAARLLNAPPVVTLNSAQLDPREGDVVGTAPAAV